MGLGPIGYVLATLHVLGRHLLSAGIAADIGAYRGPGDSAASGGNILAGSVADLVTENAVNEGASNGPGDVGAALILDNLLTLDPAALLRCSDHRTYGSDGDLIEPLVVPPTVVGCCN